ncbi:bifunctional hydroxymethylpyrimidine kinase/phosphomethylpyrimidine kinase [Neorhodopirellula pilleata]|uniref:hydroxymethylpyrimidine kinase n=1 Tax=Neorhodopirellula pilleata TaxID=2714738 RepID=A0A5C6A9Y0_9BACT|nr:bifunctional hydroxymethylpyrimidine kinase/phosphomethylpyrimidine kinase [Neorhodopirellula pilleata]TWT96369.1 Hydroxymethylpyrimidine/phosphomethylpyrimidine kinase [Neorhodopirellula pilleata]
MAGSEDRKVEIAPHAIALTIAGSDPSGGAGLQADLKAFQQNGVYGMAVVTLLTVQNTLGVGKVEMLSPELIGEQIDAVLSDIPPRCIKTGALGNAAIIACVADKLHAMRERIDPSDCLIVVDPVMVSKHGDRLIDDDAVAAYHDELLPLADLITPNRFEAERLLQRGIGTKIDDLLAATQDLQDFGPTAVLLKAGAVDGQQMHVFTEPEQLVTLTVDRYSDAHTHGAGCSLSAVIAARLALSSPQDDQATRMREAIDFAIAAVNHAIHFAPKYGHGCGPIESRLLHFGD